MSAAPTKRVAVLGLGAMGQRMARRLLGAGYRVVVWNRSAASASDLVAIGAEQAETPAEAVAGAQFALSMVRDDAASHDVWLAPRTGAVHGLDAAAVALDCSTLTPAHCLSLAGELAGRCGHFAVAPVLGSRPQAEAGKLVALVGGEGDARAAVGPVLETFCARIEDCGGVDQAAGLKLAINAFFASQVAVMAEILAGLRRQGVADDVSTRVLSGLPVVAPGLELALASMVAGNFVPQFPIELVAKDLGYFDQALGQVEGSTVSKRVLEVYSRAVDAGLGGSNVTGVLALYRDA